jgi:hypothetical protein
MSNVDLQNLYDRVPLDIFAYFTIRGVEFEFEWYEASVAANTGKVWLRFTAPADKYSVINFREVRHDQTRGFYRLYAEGDFSGGTVDRTLDMVKMRPDSPVDTGTTLEVLTGVTADPADAFASIPLWGVEGVGNRPQGGGLAGSTAVRVIPPGSVILLEFENNSTNAAAWYAYFKQWEIAPKALPEAGEL